jgi:hypothetical protein
VGVRDTFFSCFTRNLQYLRLRQGRFLGGDLGLFVSNNFKTPRDLHRKFDGDKIVLPANTEMVPDKSRYGGYFVTS